ncbi:MAG TPA: glucosidase, partial [Isosphaeraceae bacterium]
MPREDAHGAHTGPRAETAEHRRLADSAARRADWKQWGPYVSERAWGTVREDYSPDGNAWDSFPHDHARARAYRWNEDGLAGFCNRFQNLCLGLALWNGRDPFLKERLFGLANGEGNHGEDVKEYYFYLDGVPSHAYMRMLYKYPRAAYPYARLVEESRRRTRAEPEFELVDALGDELRQGRYFDVFVEYAKADQEDILGRVTAVNRGPEPAELHVLPQAWFRNTWSWGHNARRPELRADGPARIRAEHRHLGERWWYLDTRPGTPALLFTENDTNAERLFGSPNASPFVKDAFHACVVGGQPDRVNPARTGTKAAAHYRATLGPGEQFVVGWRFADRPLADPFDGFGAVFDRRIAEADEFYAAVGPPGLTDDERLVQRQAAAGLLWSKQFYHYSVELWLDGDPAGPPPPEVRRAGRNAGWRHAYNLDVLSVPDKWEYPWFAAWDSAFQCIALARLDPEWAKRQLVLLLREWYMHPSGQLPAYEWDFADVNPPVHAHAALRVYQIARAVEGRADTNFLEEVFHKLLLNFTWWVNRKDPDGRNAFQGGFLGLDNIGVFDRSKPLPTGGHINQADGTAWMAMYSLNLMKIALALAVHNRVYQDVASKFFEHFLHIAEAMTNMAGDGIGLWDDEDKFYYDELILPDGNIIPLKVRS